jgi:anti-anti-sigma factor
MEIRERRPAVEVRQEEAQGPALSIRCEVRARTTVVTVRGTVDEAHCDKFAEGLEMARMMRGRGPILVDLSGVDRLGSAAMRCLVRALRDAEQSGRALTLQL